MGKIYKITRGSFVDREGIDYVKGQMIDIDNFPGIKNRVNRFVENGMIEPVKELPSEIKPKSDVEITKEKLDIEIEKFSKEKLAFLQEKKDYQVEMQTLRKNLEKEIDLEWQKIKKAKEELANAKKSTSRKKQGGKN